MIKRLAEREMVVHTPYKGVELTDLGLRRALNVVRRHRLWERFLVDHLEIAWEQVHDMACRLEHATSDDLSESLSRFLAHPAFCPHGNPIPSADGLLNIPPAIPLTEVGMGATGSVIRIHREETPLLNYLAERGIVTGTGFRLLDISPYNGPLVVQIEDRVEVMLGREIAARVFVRLDQV
jgi:DtxR family Mn-dependent transcriptional regulator